MEDYTKARKKGEKAFRQAVLEGRFPYIKTLDEQFEATGGTHLGIMDIPLEYIVGTKTTARQNAFACNFLPLYDEDTEFGMKWANLFRIQEEEGFRDPVTVYEYLHEFYVLEGNKRVSVMKYLDVATITADVTRIPAKVKDERYEAFLRFYAVCPLYELYFTDPTGYRRLARLVGKTLDAPWDEKTVRMLRASYYLFANAYRKKEYDISCSDAFLDYLAAYDLAGIMSVSKSEMEKRLLRITENTKTDLLGIASLKKIIPFAPVLKTAFVYAENPAVSAADYEHEVGRLLAANRYHDQIATVSYTDCADPSRMRRTLEEAASKNDVVFCTSDLFLDEAYRCAVHHPAVKFCCSTLQERKNIHSYEARIYEAKFLLGALAAVYARNHLLAYIADYPIAGTIAEINAFAIGAAMIDPNIKVYLGWTGTLDQDWQEQMKQLRINVFSGAELPDFKSDSLEYGIYMFTEEGVVNLAYPVINRAVLYEGMIEQFENKEFENLWYGMAEGAVDVHVSQQVPYATRKLVQLLKNALIKGTLNPFDGELHSQEKTIKGPLDAKLSDKELIRMDWLNDNIIGGIPSYHELNEPAKRISEISGVKG